MIVEIGHFSLILALFIAGVQGTITMIGAHRNIYPFMAIAKPAAIIQFILVLGSFSALTYAFLVSDFSVTNVAANSHSTKPILYKISGVWGNHEGSMLLWMVILVVFNYFIFKSYNK